MQVVGIVVNERADPGQIDTMWSGLVPVVMNLTPIKAKGR